MSYQIKKHGDIAGCAAHKEAFTLIEVLLVLGIAGMILAAGVAPLTYTIRTISDARQNFTANNMERTAVNRIFQDVRESIALNVQSPLFIVHRDGLGGKGNDLLMVWTITPSYANASIGSVVYGFPQRTVLGDDLEDGIYRWVLSDDTLPGSLNPEDLKPEAARLILRGLKGVSFNVLSGSSWEESYSGPLPKAFRVTLQYDEGDVVYEDMLPSF
ncbi:MAG: type II secretion system GspH family protein [Synergistaceae bacterium]|jgi:prepilin-type N-terminal cleavage/methylation domain-containing protein|nr:type II secretion system GspH family protein [Synergistaceae bacterium]